MVNSRRHGTRITSPSIRESPSRTQGARSRTPMGPSSPRPHAEKGVVGAGPRPRISTSVRERRPSGAKAEIELGLIPHP